LFNNSRAYAAKSVVCSVDSWQTGLLVSAQLKTSYKAWEMDSKSLEPGRSAFMTVRETPSNATALVNVYIVGPDSKKLEVTGRLPLYLNTPELKVDCGGAN